MPAIRTLKLYVWEDALTDRYPGIIVAVAPDLRAAKTAVRQAHGIPSPTVEDSLRVAPKVIRLTADTPPQAWLAWGGS
jgi:hypothetical protein